MSFLGDIGTVVWCNDKKMRGTVVSASSLGIRGAPSIEFANGQRSSYFGDSLNTCCQYIDQILDLVEEADRSLVRDLWFEKTAGVHQRLDFFTRVQSDPTFDIKQHLQAL
jgi:hypothetical protein